MPKVAKTTSLQYLCSMLKKMQRMMQRMKLIFACIFCRHVQITQDKKVAISLQHLKKEVNDKVDFLHADKRQTFF